METISMTDNIFDFISNAIKANALGVKIVYAGEVKDFKKGTKNNRTEVYKRFYNEEKNCWNVSKETIYKNVTLGRVYENSVNNRIENESTFETEKPKGKHFILFPYLLASDTDENKVYLRIFENKNTERKTTYFINGKQADEDEVRYIKDNLPKKNYVAVKQIESGVNEDNQVILKDIELTKIKEIRFGNKVYYPNL